MEGKLGRVDVVIGAIIKSRLDVKHWIASDNTAFESFFGTFHNWFTIFERNDAAFNLINKLEAFTWLVWLKLNPDVAILTATAGLLDVFTLSFGSAADGFAIGYLWLASVSFNVKFTLEAVDNDIEMELAHARNNGLAGFFVGMNTEGRIFFGELAETDSHLLLVSLSLRLNGDRYRWIRKLD